MSDRSLQLYDAVWCKIRELIPSLKVDQIKCGFKENSVNAIHQNLKESILQGTWHHYIIVIINCLKSTAFFRLMQICRKLTTRLITNLD